MNTSYSPWICDAPFLWSGWTWCLSSLGPYGHACVFGWFRFSLPMILKKFRIEPYQWVMLSSHTHRVHTYSVIIIGVNDLTQSILRISPEFCHPFQARQQFKKMSLNCGGELWLTEKTMKQRRNTNVQDDRHGVFEHTQHKKWKPRP